MPGPGRFARVLERLRRPTRGRGREGALNLAALNLANALGAIGGAVTLDAGRGTLSTVWAGFVMTAAGLLLYVTTVARMQPAPVPSLST
jgi:predicted MFS family arabinose efflux permease